MKKTETIREYIDYLLQAMDLKDWDIRISESTPDPDENVGGVAEIVVAETQRQAALRLSEAFWKETPAEQCRILVHEFIHVHLKPLLLVVLSTEDVLGVAAANIVGKAFSNAEEYATDALAIVVARGLRNPSFAKKTQVAG